MWFYIKNQEHIGPISWEHLTEAARNGRLLPADAVWTHGMPQWQPAGTVAGLFAAAPPSVGYIPQPKQDSSDVMLRMAIPIGRSWWAIAAGYFGLFSFIILPAPISLILSLIALHDIRRHPEKLGRGRAIFGLIMGFLGTALLLWALIVMAPHH